MKPAQKSKEKMATSERLPGLYIPPSPHVDQIPDNKLFALSTVDGRDRRLTKSIAPYFSEFATFTTRAEISGKYLIALDKLGGVLPRALTAEEIETLNTFGEKMTEADVEDVKAFERKTNHDVVALRLHMKKKFSKTSLADLSEFNDIFLTSDDKNNLTFRLNLMRATHAVILPILDNLDSNIGNVRQEHAETVEEARTHGQAAGPTTAGKEFGVFQERLRKQVKKLAEQRLTGKLNGAVGNWSSMRYVHPEKDWINFSRDFVESLGLTPNDMTTQINPYDDVAEYLQNYTRINNILVGLDDDMWHYISDNWIVQIPKAGEAGSSAMPQKVNPIDFEKSEGNLEEATDLMEGFARRLPRSRFQRDLRDSTQIRNVGLALGLATVGYASILEGFPKTAINASVMKDVLNNDWTILSEPVQVYLRAFTDVADPYELMKQLVRGNHMGQEQWHELIDNLPVSKDHKDYLKKLTPETYLGYAVELAKGVPKKI
jgi:adenylosuccinate lyase